MSLSPRSGFARSASLFAVAALTVTTACSEGLTAPTQAAPAAPAAPANGLVHGLLGGVSELVGSLIPVKALKRNVAATRITRSVKFTKTGGAIEIAELGLRVEVPYGAIPRDTMTITVTSLPGKMIAYDFLPHGTKFLKPLVFRQSLVGTSWDSPLFVGVLNGGYFKSPTQLNEAKGTAVLDELLPALVLTKQVTFNIHHFSGYMVSSGRQSSSYSNDDSF